MGVQCQSPQANAGPDDTGALLRWDLEPWDVELAAPLLAQHLSMPELEVRQWVGAPRGILCRQKPLAALHAAASALAEQGLRAFVVPTPNLVRLPKPVRVGAQANWDQESLRPDLLGEEVALPWTAVAAANVGYVLDKSMGRRPSRGYGTRKIAETLKMDAVAQGGLSLQAEAPVRWALPDEWLIMDLVSVYPTRRLRLDDHTSFARLLGEAATPRFQENMRRVYATFAWLSRHARLALPAEAVGRGESWPPPAFRTDEHWDARLEWMANWALHAPRPPGPA